MEAYEFGWNEIKKITIMSIDPSEQAFWIRNSENKRRKIKIIIPKDIKTDLIIERLNRLKAKIKQINNKIRLVSGSLKGVNPSEFRNLDL